MKKLLSLAFALVMLFALAIPAAAVENSYDPYKVKDGWYVDIADEVEGTLVFHDIKGKGFPVEIDGAGTYFITLQRDANGKLGKGIGTLTPIEEELTYVDVLIGYTFEESLVRRPNGNLSDLTITVTETWERHWSNGDVELLPDVVGTGEWEVPNSVNDLFDVTVNVNEYTFRVVIRGGGNAEFTVTDVTE